MTRRQASRPVHDRKKGGPDVHRCAEPLCPADGTCGIGSTWWCVRHVPTGFFPHERGMA
jgi:hypothetical protein